jgi:hypothetical protein
VPTALTKLYDVCILIRFCFETQPELGLEDEEHVILDLAYECRDQIRRGLFLASEHS